MKHIQKKKVLLKTEKINSQIQKALYTSVRISTNKTMLRQIRAKLLKKKLNFKVSRKQICFFQRNKILVRYLFNGNDRRQENDIVKVLKSKLKI